MLAGHLAAGLIGKRIEPKVSLGTWMLAVLLADIIVFPLMIAGVESFHPQAGAARNRFVGEIPYSHSLVMVAIYGALFAAAYFVRKHNPRAAWLLLAAVLSHWVLDFVSHRPDMQLAPGAHAAFGLGLWNSRQATWIAEGGFWVLALVVYVRATRTKKRLGIYAFWIGVVLLTLAWNNNITAGVDPNPVRAGIGGLVFFSLIVAWAYWMERLRPVIADYEN